MTLRMYAPSRVSRDRNYFTREFSNVAIKRKERQREKIGQLFDVANLSVEDIEVN